jgi:hypothetical protein
LAFRPFEVLPSQIGKLEVQAVDFERSIKSHTSELTTLKASVSKLTSPPIIGGFKSTESIHVFVPGSTPLEEGMIGFLTKRAGGNVCDRQAIHAFSTSVHDTSNKHIPKLAADLSTDSYFCSSSGSNQSFGYDFKENQRISPTHYAIRSVASWGTGQHHPKSWVIEVSIDRSNESLWTEIDRRTDNQDLNHQGIVQTFRISHPPNQEFRYIRIRQVANHHNDNFLGFSALEFFGQLRIQTATPL